MKLGWFVGDSAMWIRRQRTRMADLQRIVIHSAAEALEPRRLLSATPTLLADLFPGATGSGIQSFTEVNGVAFFWANDGVNGP